MNTRGKILEKQIVIFKDINSNLIKQINKYFRK